jgi:preprotein translocase subunit SecG
MLGFIVVLITIVCILLTLIVLIQNPKGGGLDANFGGMGNQTFGVKRTTDLLEKSTWTLAIILILFSLLSKFFVSHSSPSDNTSANPIEQTR